MNVMREIVSLLNYKGINLERANHPNFKEAVGPWQITYMFMVRQGFQLIDHLLDVQAFASLKNTTIIAV
jgi:hypothetical protein